MDFVFNYIDLVGGLSYLGLFIFAFGAGYFIPVPEEVVLLVTGYLASAEIFNLPVAITVAFLALIISDNILFKLSKSDYKYIKKMRIYISRSPFIKKRREKMEKHIYLTIFLSRFFPYMRFVGPILAGSLNVKHKTFFIYNTLAMAVYVPLFTFIGYAFNSDVDFIIWRFESLRHTVFVIAMFAIIVYGIVFIHKYVSNYLDELNEE